MGRSLQRMNLSWGNKLSKSIQTLYKLLVSAYTPDCKKQQYWNNDGKDGGEIEIAFTRNKLLRLGKEQHQVQDAH